MAAPDRSRHAGVLAEQGVEQSADQPTTVAASTATFVAVTAGLALAIRHVTSFRQARSLSFEMHLIV